MGVTAELTGRTKMTFQARGQSFTIEAFVMPRARQDVVLGNTFLREEKAVIDYNRLVLHCGAEKRITLSLMGREPQQTSGAPLPRTGFPAELKPQVDKVLRDFEHVLMPGPGRLVGTKTIQHEIHLTNPRPFQLTPYHYSEDKRIEIERQVQEMLANGVIEPSNSPYNSPIVLAKKKGGQWRFCIDFRRLNELTVDTAQQIPRISDALKDLGEATVFSTLDLKSGYWQIPMAPEAGKYTAFTTPTGGAYQFRVMPFGLKGAPGTFQRMMAQEVLTGYLTSSVWST
ncbi:unnamed protein product [Trichogramma brassicae]|uniref:Reverse transcriptase domain-containing protein n=1 Tax=Trichogramma brassicae TaxID=86971 RepID=A0A6H5I7T9_9HYME|nr:unnamed protein product [Trichogramma brassicae]